MPSKKSPYYYADNPADFASLGSDSDILKLERQLSTISPGYREAEKEGMFGNNGPLQGTQHLYDQFVRAYGAGLTPYQYAENYVGPKAYKDANVVGDPALKKNGEWNPSTGQVKVNSGRGDPEVLSSLVHEFQHQLEGPYAPVEPHFMNYSHDYGFPEEAAKRLDRNLSRGGAAPYAKYRGSPVVVLPAPPGTKFPAIVDE